MASQGAKRLAEDRASVEYLVEQYPKSFSERVGMESRVRSGEDGQLLTTPTQCGARCF